MRSKLITVAALALSLGALAQHDARPIDLRSALGNKQIPPVGFNARKPDALEAAKKSKRELFDKESLERFYNNKTAEYFVESLPDFPADLGEIYSGLITIDPSNSEDALFFVFQPKLGEPSEDLTIWLNGGPGCSSLNGWLQENGRWAWSSGTFAPVENPYSWVNLTNMLWVEQLIGTGFSTGTPKATSQEETAQDFIKAFKRFEETFGISNYKIYVTGESYAGRYVPYISAAMLDQNDTEYCNLSGALRYDPVIGAFDKVQQQMTAYPFIEANNNLFNFNQTLLDGFKLQHQNCGYEAYIDQYLTFPPSGVQPEMLYKSSDPEEALCDVFMYGYFFAWQINPCFNVYHITNMCPLAYDVLGSPTGLLYAPNGIYFNRTNVKAAMHAPDVDWTLCSVDPVYAGGTACPHENGDLSVDPIQTVLPQVIEATNRVLVSGGAYDYVVISNGTLLAIQNMTWNGQLGFQSQPSEEIYIDIVDTFYAPIFEANGLPGFPGDQTTMGIQHFERGLMWAETFQASHMQPETQPRVAYRHLQWLLGHVEKL
ncbi:hypothetical protein IAT38_002690 [Cryptococcus sp. DSM 104549]